MLSNSCVALRVKDDGAGIPESVADHIFEPFFSTKGEEQGTGLGLSIVASIMKESDGCVSLETAQGRGTVHRRQRSRAARPGHWRLSFRKTIDIRPERTRRILFRRVR